MANGIIYFEGSCFKTATAYILNPVIKERKMYISKDSKAKYFWVDINPPYANKEDGWDSIASKVEEFCYNFTSSIDDFDDYIFPIHFNFYIEKEVQFFKQKDAVSTSTYLGIPKTVKLNLHIDYERFYKSNKKNNILINGICFLLKFWKENLKIPKNVKLSEVITLFESYLKENFEFEKIENIDDIFIKSKGLFRIDFDNYRIENISEKEIPINFDKLADFINNNLHNTSYGKSVKSIYFSYDIFDFYLPENKEYLDDKKKYSYGKDKNLSIMEQFDTNCILYQERKEQLEYLKQGILNSILRIKEMERKPKFFDIDKLHIDLKVLLDEYIK